MASQSHVATGEKDPRRAREPPHHHPVSWLPPRAVRFPRSQVKSRITSPTRSQHLPLCFDYEDKKVQNSFKKNKRKESSELFCEKDCYRLALYV